MFRCNRVVVRCPRRFGGMLNEGPPAVFGGTWIKVLSQGGGTSSEEGGVGDCLCDSRLKSQLDACFRLRIPALEC